MSLASLPCRGCRSLRIALWCVGLLLVAPRAGLAAPVQWTTGSGGNGHWYERIDQTGLTFDAARNAAAGLSYLGDPGRLVIFETATYASEISIVFHNVYGPGGQGNRAYWVGASSPDGSNPWTWVDGTPVPTTITAGWLIDHAEGPGAEGMVFFGQYTTLLDYITTNSSDLVSGYVVEYAPSSAVPEIDPAGLASVLALVTGALGLLERRRASA